MTDSRRDSNNNAAWHVTQQWRERAQRSRPNGGMGGLRLVITWLMFGVLMIVGTLLGLVFLLIGWAMLPILRYRMKKRMERMRAQQAEDISGFRDGFDGASPRTQVLEGDYEVKRREVQ
ncbi:MULTISPECIES: hypothetical protein [Halomonadaceae]|uniref:hypothetical protein n=1 Tax=Halomonadaceae TaxID=28256 RepID=UPI00159B31AD|nr:MULTISPECIES: hypothetical protein [Halomonas]QJQ94567.1 hypothetical protein HIO72_04235 [Halomonas sp. PA5]